ncbi:hypothetical protein SAY86_032039 [Trapa natans]|uniref:RING-type E3 ubiquitin transferase n=1 Tax=Trapa natans TaxID=22666 RepID=A0AAN7R8W5_TRANT|nr:hypothetical protein SAY86_032039 [Trapa natans]
MLVIKLEEIKIHRLSEKEIWIIVCLCELAEGEKVRILPKCGHSFHVDCIDKWFESHDTCPLCRSPVPGEKVVSTPANSDGSTGISVRAAISTNFPSEPPASLPTNILYWGSANQVNSASGGMSVVIDIPRPEMENPVEPVSPSESGCAHDGPKL